MQKFCTTSENSLVPWKAARKRSCVFNSHSFIQSAIRSASYVYPGPCVNIILKAESSLNLQMLIKSQWHCFVMGISDCSTLPTGSLNLPRGLAHPHIKCFEGAKSINAISRVINVIFNITLATMMLVRELLKFLEEVPENISQTIYFKMQWILILTAEQKRFLKIPIHLHWWK